MKGKLIQQMLNQWRSNIWMLVQLVIVSCAIFYIFSGLYSNVSNYFAPFGYETDNTYQITLAEIPENGVGYIPERDRQQCIDDIMTIIARIKSLEDVEEVAYSNWSGPYLANFMGRQYHGISDGDTIRIIGNVKRISPEYLKVFKVKSADGTTPEQLEALLLEGKLLASKEVLGNGVRKGRSLSEMLKNPVFHNDYDSADYKVGAIVESTKRYDYDQLSPVIFQLYLPQEIVTKPEISVRLKKDSDSGKFMNSIQEQTSSFLSSGNIYVQKVQPYESIKENINAFYNKEVIQGIVCVLFLLINIFLGLFGVFWFRTRQRTSEIALRKSFGASAGSIFWNLVCEGLLLLLLSIPFSMLIDWFLATHKLTGDEMMNYCGLIPPYRGRFFIYIAATTVVMALMIIAGISLPASKAMRIEPAEALKEE